MPDISESNHSNRVLLRDKCPNMLAAEPDTQSSRKTIDSFGGEWIWESVGYGKGLKWKWVEASGTNIPDDMTWLVDGTKNNTITRCTDGSYHRKHTPKVSGVDLEEPEEYKEKYGCKHRASHSWTPDLMKCPRRVNFF